MALIVSNEIPGASVYGVPQTSYTVGGESGRDYSAAVTAATLKQATAFEAECSALTAMVKVRMKKLEELGKALSLIARVMASMKTGEKQKPDDKVRDPDNLATVKTIMERYGLSISLSDGGAQVRRDNASYAQNDVQYAMDREDNDLQQDMITVQSAFSKRDNAFSAATRLVKKSQNSARSVIGNFGD